MFYDSKNIATIIKHLARLREAYSKTEVRLAALRDDIYETEKMLKAIVPPAERVTTKEGITLTLTPSIRLTNNHGPTKRQLNILAKYDMLSCLEINKAEFARLFRALENTENVKKEFKIVDDYDIDIKKNNVPGRLS